MGGGGCHLRKIEITILTKLPLVWSWNLLRILEMSFPSFISQKLGEILIFGTFLAFLAKIGIKFWPMFHWKSAMLRSDMFITSLWRHTLDVCTYFDMYGKKKLITILWCQLHISGSSVFKFTWGGNNPLENSVTEKSLVRRDLRLIPTSRLQRFQN